jgi:hypothetical protein
MIIIRSGNSSFDSSFAQVDPIFYVVLGDMGRIIKHVRFKVLCSIFRSCLSMNRVMLRPSRQDEDVFTFMMGGPNVDCNKISTSREELVKSFYSITKRTDILFGDIIWISKYRSE